MHITNLDQVEQKKVEMPGAAHILKQVPIGSRDGSPHFSFRVFTLEPGGYTPYHEHLSEHVNYIMEGEGALVDREGKLHPLKKGDFALVKPEEKHQYRNTSPTQPMVMICAVLKEYE